MLVVSGDAVAKRRTSVCLAKDVQCGQPIMLVCYIPLAKLELRHLAFVGTARVPRAGHARCTRPPATSKRTCVATPPPLLLACTLGGQEHYNGDGPDAAAATAETKTKEPPLRKTARRLLETPLRVRAPQFFTKHAPRLDALARERFR